MIKTEDTTLQNLGLSEGSPIFVAPGRVLKDGECVDTFHRGTAHSPRVRNPC